MDTLMIHKVQAVRVERQKAFDNFTVLTIVVTLEGRQMLVNLFTDGTEPAPLEVVE
jgi:hypothetical protein